jgi:hypothetical protein
METIVLIVSKTCSLEFIDSWEQNWQEDVPSVGPLGITMRVPEGTQTCTKKN